MNHISNLLDYWFDLFGLPFGFMNLFGRLRFLSWLNIYNRNLLCLHDHYVLGLFIVVVSSLLELLLLGFLWDDCVYDSESFLFRNDCLNIVNLDLTYELIDNNFKVWVNFLHNLDTCCVDCLGSFCGGSGLNSSWNNFSGYFLFESTDPFLLLVTNDCDLLVFIREFSNRLIAYLLNCDSSRGYIDNLCIFLSNLFHNALKVSVFLNYGLIHSLGDYYLLYNICDIFTLLQ